MKEGIHPRYVLAQVSCACGNTFTTRSTQPVIKLDICSACHPLFTGKQKMLDTAGRVEKFTKRFASTEGKTVEQKQKKATVTKTTTVKAKSKILTTAIRAANAKPLPQKDLKKPAKAGAPAAAAAPKAAKAAAPKAEKKS